MFMNLFRKGFANLISGWICLSYRYLNNQLAHSPQKSTDGYGINKNFFEKTLNNFFHGCRK